MSIFDFSRQISTFRKEKKYSEALAFFKENKASFSKEDIAGNEYIISDIISSLRYTNQFDAALQFLKMYNVNVTIEQKEIVLSAYGWLLWSKYKNENGDVIYAENESVFFDDEEEESQETSNYDKSELVTSIENLIPILAQFDNAFSRTLISNLFLIVLKSEKSKPTPNWKLINEFCNNVNNKILSKDCSIIKVERKGQLKDMELASDFENWYAYKTKALMALGEWQECFDTSKEGLESIDKFHYSNDIWFSRRIALAKKNLGNTEDAIKELETILSKKREWFIQKELAELYFEKGNSNHAFTMAINAINNHGPLEFKVDLLFLLGEIFKKQSNSDLAFKHFSLAKLIRQEEEWAIPQKLSDRLGTFSNPEILDIVKLKNELKKYWNGLSADKDKKSGHKVETHLEGVIGKILHDNERGKDGFIIYDKNEYYFSATTTFHLTPKIIVGCKVTFQIIPTPDGKKERARIVKLVE